MIFQTLDDKTECVGVYVDGKLHFDKIPEDLTHTWKYAGSMADPNIKYAWLYCEGLPLQEACPEDHKERLEAVRRKLRAYKKSLVIAKVDLNDHCVFDLIPKDFLMELCEAKNLVTQHVFDTYPKPRNYSHLCDVQRLIHKIKHQRLNLNNKGCRHLYMSHATGHKINGWINRPQYVDYNLFGTVTGRLTTFENSFPMLTLKKVFRRIIKPHNDLFVSYDYNGAEIRTLLHLSGKKQPEGDIHQWNIDHVFKREIDRDLAKTLFFGWLYNPDSTMFDQTVYDKEKLLDHWYTDGYITTPYKRRIKVSKRKAFNYLIQSTTADRVLEKAVIIDELLESKKSFISHIMHDEIVLDFHKDDVKMLPVIKNIFETEDFKTNIKGGKNYFDLEAMTP
jgi:hypothetical protein